MSATNDAKLVNLLNWLESNAFWNIDFLELDISKTTSGIGVFYKPNEQEAAKREDNDDDGDEEIEDDDDLLLRIPKSNILSPKNSVIWNLLVDFHENYASNIDINLTDGMHSIVISFIYELSKKEESPWFHFLESIVPDEKDESINNIPICLWSDDEKKALHNSECDLLNMLDNTELVQFFVECVNFGKLNAKYIDIPYVLNISIPSSIEDITDDDIKSDSLKNHIVNNNNDKLLLFGKYVQTVISRAFQVDNFHGLSLIPGADLFNHTPPFINEDGRIEGKEDVHFVCDGGDEVCEVCGDQECEDHIEEDNFDNADEDSLMNLEFGSDGELIDEEEDVSENLANDNDLEIEDDLDEDNFDDENDEILGDSEVDDEELYSSSDDDLDESLMDETENFRSEELGSDDGDKNDDDNEGSITEDLVEPEEITMEYIKQMENELDEESDSENDESDANSEAETSHEEEEVSTVSLSDNEEDENSLEYSISAREELALELSDNSKCCDIVLSKAPRKDVGSYELYNTYGNNLSNAYLLQRYGFIDKTNINDNCLLSVQVFQYIKEFKASNTERKINQLNNKLAWYEEMGFEFVNDLVCQYESRPLNVDHSVDHEKAHGHEEDGCCSDDECDNEAACNDGCCGGNEEEFDEHTEILEENLPESWQLSPRIKHDGKITPQTYALVKLLLIPYKVFHYKFIECASERKLAKRIFQTLLPYEYEKDIQNEIDVPKIDKYAGQINEIVKKWSQQRLDRYQKDSISAHGVRGQIINGLIELEKAILNKSIAIL